MVLRFAFFTFCLSSSIKNIRSTRHRDLWTEFKESGVRPVPLTSFVSPSLLGGWLISVWSGFGEGVLFTPVGLLNRQEQRRKKDWKDKETPQTLKRILFLYLILFQDMAVSLLLLLVVGHFLFSKSSWHYSEKRKKKDEQTKKEN